MDNRPIGMFDSGVGGLTVLKEIINKMPNEDIIYIGDTASFPYGSKSKETIIELTRKRVAELVQKDVKLIVIACGTATSQALQEVRKDCKVPIIGIIEATVNYLKQMEIKNIGVIATTGTIRSNGWQKEIYNQIKDCNVKTKACPLLAPMAEEGWTNNEIARLTIQEYMKDIKDVDALILGCTHYPLFKKFIVQELKKGSKVINTGEMLSEEVKLYIKTHNLESEKKKAEYEIFLTDTECNFVQVAGKLLKDENIINNIRKI